MSADERLARLPLWAQQRIQKLERDLAYAKARLAEGSDSSRVFADPYADPPRPLGHDTAIEFRLGKGWGERVVVRIEKDKIVVQGGDRLAVHPWATNVVHLSVGGAA